MTKNKTGKTPTKNRIKIKTEIPVKKSKLSSAKSARGRKKKGEENSSPFLQNLVPSTRKSAKKSEPNMTENALNDTIGEFSVLPGMLYLKY